MLLKDTLISLNTEPDVPKVSLGYTVELNVNRDKINKIDSEKWKKVRWYINEYDFLVKNPLINRAFYKYWEIINEFNIFENFKGDDCVFHCAEAPGGFIQGSNMVLQKKATKTREIDVPKESLDGFISVDKLHTKKKKDFRVFTISLNKDLPKYKNYNLPSYNSSILTKHVFISYGDDNTGDINNLLNIKHIERNCQKRFYLVTGDGGFDEGTDFNNKEQLHYSLILNEIYWALKLQQKEGHFILKVFDIFTTTSLHLLYALFCAYEEVYIYKPNTSRPTNSEKYVICKGYKGEIVNKELIDKLESFSVKIKSMELKNMYISFEIFEDIPSHFIDKIHTINIKMTERQCMFLQQALILCEDETFIDNYNKNVNKLIQGRKEKYEEWESKYNLRYFIK